MPWWQSFFCHQDTKAPGSTKKAGNLISGRISSGSIDSIEFSVIYSARRTLGISVLTDGSVIVRVPFRTSEKSIYRIVSEKSAWIIRHRDKFKELNKNREIKTFTHGSSHLYRGNSLILNITSSGSQYVKFNGETIEAGIKPGAAEITIGRLLQSAYRKEAERLLPNMFYNIIEKYRSYDFKPTSLRIRTMKRRWGSCSSRGRITLNSELIKLDDTLTEYVIIHELCHLKHHNHGPKFYELLSQICPDWKDLRKKMKGNLF